MHNDVCDPANKHNKHVFSRRAYHFDTKYRLRLRMSQALICFRRWIRQIFFNVLNLYRLKQKYVYELKTGGPFSLF